MGDKMAITIVGSVALDDVKTPFGEIHRGLGGSGSHFSVASSFFTEVNLVGVVGEDFPKEHIEFFKSRKINLEGLQIQKGKTFYWRGYYDYDLNNAKTLETQLNVFENFAPHLPDSYKNPNILFLGNIHPDLQNHVIDQAGKPGMIALDTMNYWIVNEKKSLLKTMARVDVLTINETEARLLADTPNVVTAARKLQKIGPKVVVLKRGEYGCLLFFGNDVFSAPALPIENVFDPTGAGDSFAGGMMGYLSQSPHRDFNAFKTAVICGSVMASFSVEKFSCDRLRSLDSTEIAARFKAFETLAHFNGIG